MGGRWLAADEYTIADMATYPWARAYVWAKVSVDGLDNLKAWVDRLDARPEVQKALTIPKAQPAFWGQGDDTEFLKENAARFASDVSAA